jgi:hypothetical protein
MVKTSSSKFVKATTTPAAQPIVNTPMGVTLTDVQTMDDKQLHDFLINVQNVDTPDFLNTHHTQKMVYGLGMNDLPQVVPDAQLQKLISNGAKPIYRSVNGATLKGGVSMTASDIQDVTRYGDLTYLGNGIYGDGLYFSNNLRGSKGYGSTTMQGVLSPNAKTISDRQLKNEYDSFIKTHPRTRKALGFSRSKSTTNSMSQFALIKGYSVITHTHSDGEVYYNVISRSALIVSDKNI